MPKNICSLNTHLQNKDFIKTGNGNNLAFGEVDGFLTVWLAGKNLGPLHTGSWENITTSCNFGHISEAYGTVYKNSGLRMVVFLVIIDKNVPNQSPILTIGTLPGNASVIVLGIGVHETASISVDIKNDGYIVRSSHSQDRPISNPRYLGIALF